MSPEAILQRLNPLCNFEPVQYLHRVEELLREDRWVWSEERNGAFRFASYEDAEKNREAHRYQDSKGKWHVPFAFVVADPDAREPELVVGSPARRAGRRKKTMGERAAIGRKASRAHFQRRRVSATEAFSALEKRGLA